MNNNQMKPCLVNTSQGFSILYKEKYLYSKYNPSKAIIQKINELNILPGTIFLCFSPVLSYGLKELLQKIPENCLVIACEFDKELYSFSKDLDELKKLNDEFENFVFPDLKEVYNLPIIINSRKYLFNSKKEICFDGKYKRIVSVDFSAGVQFNQSLYSELEKACVNSIKTFWTNRITLTKFGRKYSRNLFKNLINHAGTKPIENYFKSVNKPLIVLGAGESFAESIKYLENSEDYFIICADTAFQPLLKNQIVPDAVFIEEAQNVILKAFIGTQNQKTHFFAGLSSIPQLKDFVSKDKISYFASIYSNSEFLENLQTKEFFPYANKPFGSVGLTSVFYAIKFRQDERVPIYLFGLDFSYSCGKTHTNGTLAHNELLLNSNRLKSSFNFASCFSSYSVKLNLLSGKQVFSSPVLLNYAQMFEGLFEEIPNLFLGTKNTFPFKLEVKNPQKEEFVKSSVKKEIKKINKEEIKKYFEEEIQSLENLKSLLIGESDLNDEERMEKIETLAKKREYLFLHFADGERFKSDLSFLKRVRIEIDFFLKDFLRLCKKMN